MIESALGWIGDLAQFLGSWLPHLVVVQSSHMAVKYRNGWEPVLLSPGRHVYWPVMSPIETCAVVRQTLDIPPHLIETADRVTVVASGVVEYEVDDAIQFLARTENGYDSIRNVAGAVIRQVVKESTMEEICDEDEATLGLLLLQIQEALTAYGVRIISVRLADCARVRALHLSGRSLVTVMNEHSDTIE